ncbi:hypothetical protein IQ225_06195 [Synechocystis salina LEGE 06155]|nr:hypothetical protein [Synechocystis salina LEGE 06155]
MRLKKAVLTIATGKPIYIQMAVNLARSFKWWHKDSDIKFVIATDQKAFIPPDLSDIEIVELLPNQYGQGFSTKLHLDQITPGEKTLFVDADCLCVGSLESVFDRFVGHTVSVIGKTILEGDFFGDVESIRKQFSLDYLPYFVGGLYYLEKNNLCTKIFETARNLEPRYDEMGLIRLRGRPNEEPLMAIAMSMNGQKPIVEDGTIKAEPMFYPSGMVVDVIKGRATLYNRENHTNYCTVWGINESNPLIVHFHSSDTERHHYKVECLKLEKLMTKQWYYGFVSAYGFIKFTLPELIKDFLKQTFRPLYRKIFGVRSIKKSERIIE